jgi:serine/threonine protein kinase
MATMFGRFEIQSELSKSETASIYKATDNKTEQVVALKTQDLKPLGERMGAFVESLLAEGEASRDLAHQNIVALYGAGEIEGQFCAAMEYIQGNSIATMIARNEGFSIWDLLDITRQVCAGLDHAASKNVVHSSLEPAKIMVQWDGMVKLLGYGISNMSLLEAEAGNGLGRLMPYCSPEQIRGEEMDLRSNIFTLGSILYEMVVGRKAFDAADPVTLVQRIENDMPASPSSVNPRIQPAVSTLVMKALAKDPAERYQNARELLEDLEKCKENGKKTETVKKPAAATMSSPQARAEAASKFVTPASSASAEAPRPPAPKTPVSRPKPPVSTPKPASSFESAVKPAAGVTRPAPASTPTPASAGIAKSPSPFAQPLVTPNPPQPAPTFGQRAEAAVDNKAAAAAAGVGFGGSEFSINEPEPSEFEAEKLELQGFDSPSANSQNTALMSSAAVEMEPAEETHETPRVAVDPMMAAPAPASKGKSFSDLDELPPMKEPVFTPPPASEPEPSVAPPSQSVQLYPRKKAEEKPKIQPREVAEKAFQEISTIPPKLMLFSILGAVALILVVSVAIFFHVRNEDDGSTAAPRPMKAATEDTTPPAAQAEAPARTQAPARAPAPAAPAAKPVAPESAPAPAVVTRANVRQLKKNARTQAPVAAAPALLAGQALVDSVPQGAQFQVDGRSDPSFVTPFTVTGLNAGKHIVSVSKTGYSSDIRSVDVQAGASASLLFHLTAMNALLVVGSTPPGAAIMIDGKVTGRMTPSQFAIEKGNHTVLLRKQGFLDETITTELGPAQNFQYAPTLRALGNVDDIKTVGKLNHLFGRGGDGTAGMGTISIHTSPKGAQIAINQHLVDKTSPVEVMLGPGNYIIDITLTGFKPVHKIVTVDKGGKTPIDETLERE